MRDRIAWPTIVSASLLLGAAYAHPCAAQTPPRPIPTPPTGAAGPGPEASLPQSTVSPAIERFMKQGGRDSSPTPAAIKPATTPAGPADGPAIPPREGRGSRALPDGLPPLPDDLPPLPDSMASARGAGDSATAAPDPLATGLALEPAPADPSDRRYPINLATALRLSDARPLVVAAAQAGVWVAEAELTKAKALWVPSALVGFDYIRHDGGGPDFNKGILTAPSVNFFYAGPSLYQYVNLTDVYFEPLVARQVLDARQWDVQAAKNDALMRTADAYFRVHQSRGTYAGALYAVERGRELVGRVVNLSQDLVPKVEADRARNMLADLEQRAVSAREHWRVSSADLSQVLRLDPRAVVEPMEHDHAQVTLIDPARPLDELMAVALCNRPELASNRALVRAAETRVRREKARPLLPLVMLNGFQSAGMLIQGGIFGTGPNSSLNQYDGRSDVSIQLMWQLEGFGVGNAARVKDQRGRESRAIVDLRDTQDEVAADVTRAHARVQSAAPRVYQADRALRTAIITFNGHLEGLQQTQRFGDVLVLTFRPQEAVYSLQLLNAAFEEYFATVSEYNRAQFELFHALGYPAREVSCLRTPGPILPADTTRPHYLPPVGHGPPPATR
jgi:hypothetical protein